MKEFMNNAKGLSRNPLGIIALFISLIYGFACLVLGIAGDKLETCERIPLIYFLIGFPVLILISFLFLVTKHHNKLYAPKDYRDERNFFKGFENQRVNIDGNDTPLKSQDPIDGLIKWGSVKGLYAIYAAYLSKIYNVKFTLKDLESNSSLLTEDYTHGFMVAASSMGAFTFSSHEQPFQILGFNKKLEDNIKDLVYKYAEIEKTEENSDFLYNELSMLESAFEKANKNK
jgi:hypothetical protein